MTQFEGCPGSQAMSFKDQDGNDADQERRKNQIAAGAVADPNAPYFHPPLLTMKAPMCF